MKSKQTPSPKVKRKHGPSRLERLLEASIRQELQIKKLWAFLGNPQLARSDNGTAPAELGNVAHNRVATRLDAQNERVLSDFDLRSRQTRLT
jgi:hypothetical protein